MPAMPTTTAYFFDRAYWAGFIDELPRNEEYLGFSIFPEQDVPTDRLEWDRLFSGGGLAPFVAPGAESPLIDREQRSKQWLEVVYMRLKAALNEHDVRSVLEWIGDPNGNTQQGAMRRSAMANIERQVADISKRVDARLEWLQMGMLQGGVTVTANIGSAREGTSNVQFTIAQSVKTVTASPLWTDTVNSDPLLDMQNWFDVTTLGVSPRPRVMIVPHKVLLNISRNQKLARQMFANTPALPTTMSLQATKQYVSSELGLELVEYDAVYRTRTYSGTTRTWSWTDTRFLPDNKVLFLPSRVVGNTFTAPSAYADWATGKFTWTHNPIRAEQIIEPLVWEVGCGYYGLPGIERPETVICATVG